MDINDQIWNQVRDLIRGRVLDQVTVSFYRHVRGQVYDPVMVQIWDQGLDQVQIQIRVDLDGY